ncbi:MAG TPA: NAD(P)H-binding protein [Lacisediminihabitans sp.]|uniref:NAD(P)H-binding protein n=1 Tax=Lacisediminihabitans sp. TaxID=2787631 RepID=UPI002ED7E664
MRIVIAGGHGKIALLLSRLLTHAGHEPIGLIRDPAQADEVLAAGATPVVLDLEQTDVGELRTVLERVDAVVFAAGAGPGGGNARKLSLDRDGAILLADAAVAAGVRRMVVVSSVGADEGDPTSDDTFQVYLRAKGEADAAVRERDLDWTIVRPVALTDDPPTGHVTVGDRVVRGSIPRADVAAVIAGLLDGDGAIRRQFELTGGDTPIEAALGSL